MGVLKGIMKSEKSVGGLIEMLSMLKVSKKAAKKIKKKTKKLIRKKKRVRKRKNQPIDRPTASSTAKDEESDRIMPSFVGGVLPWPRSCVENAGAHLPAPA